MSLVDCHFIDPALINSKDLKIPLELEAYLNLPFFLIKNKENEKLTPESQSETWFSLLLSHSSDNHET